MRPNRFLVVCLIVLVRPVAVASQEVMPAGAFLASLVGDWHSAAVMGTSDEMDPGFRTFTAESALRLSWTERDSDGRAWSGTLSFDPELDRFEITFAAGDGRTCAMVGTPWSTTSIRFGESATCPGEVLESTFEVVDADHHSFGYTDRSAARRYTRVGSAPWPPE